MRTRRTPLIAVLLALLGASSAVAWWMAREQRDVALAAERAADDRASSTDALKRTTDASKRTADIVTPHDALRTNARTQLASTTKPGEPIPFSLDGATWIEGSLVFPAETPTDERVTVAARGYPTPELPDHANDLTAVQWAGDEPGEARALVARVELDDHGRFRVPIAKGMRSAALWIEAHYLFVESVTPAKSGDTAIAIAPRLGGRIIGRLILPARMPDGFDDAALRSLAIELSSFGGARLEHAPTESTTTLDTELAFDFGGLAAERAYFLHCSPTQFVAPGAFNVKVEPGRSTSHDLELTLGTDISGVCIDEQGAPVAGASLQVEPRRDLSWLTNSARRTTSASDGTFRLQAVAPGKLVISGEAKGFVALKSDELEAVDGERVDRLTLRFTRGSSVAGVVRWPNGKPVSDARVSLHESTSQSIEDERAWQREEAHAAETDVGGRFAISGLGPGPFSVLAERAESGEQNARRIWRARALDVHADATVELTLQEPISVKGRVADDLGAPIESFDIESAEVAPDDAPHSGVYARIASSFENAHGSFEVWLTPGPWKLSPSAEGFGRGEGQSIVVPTNGAELAIVLSRVGRISGTVVDASGAPPRSAHVSWQPTSGARAPSQRNTNEDVAVRDDGTFELVGLAPGSYSIAAHADGFAPSDPAAVELASGATVANVELHLRVGGRVTGEILAPDGRGDPERNIVASLGGNFDRTPQATSDAAGHFELDHLPPGTYQLLAEPKFDGGELTGGSTDVAELMSSIKMTTVEVRDGETVHVVLGAPPKNPLRLFGRVTSAEHPLPNTLLVALAEGGAFLQSMKAVRTDLEGNYEVKLDKPGEYSILIGDDVNSGRGAEFHATVPEGREFHLDFALPLGRIAGRVTKPDGTPASGVQVELASSGGFSILSLGGGSSVSSDELGNFVFESLHPGSYTLRAGVAQPWNASGPAAHFGAAVQSGIVVAENRAVEGVELRLSEACKLTGTVKFADGSAAIGASIFVRNAQGALESSLSSVASDGAGKFSYDALAPGVVTVNARLAGFAARESAPLALVAGAANTIELVLEKGEMLHVSLVDSAKKPVRSTVSVLDDKGHEMNGLSSLEAMQALMTAGFSSTRFDVGPLPAGKYRVSATSADGRAKSQDLALDGEGETTLELALEN